MPKFNRDLVEALGLEGFRSQDSARKMKNPVLALHKQINMQAAFGGNILRGDDLEAAGGYIERVAGQKGLFQGRLDRTGDDLQVDRARKAQTPMAPEFAELLG